VNTIVAGNTAASGDSDVQNDATLTASGANIVETPVSGSGTVNGSANISNVAPDLGPLQDNGGPTFTHLPQPGSPAIDTGDDSFLSESALPVDFTGDGDTDDTLTSDQRGLARVLGNAVDIGAVETGYTSTEITLTPGSGEVQVTLETAEGVTVVVLVFPAGAVEQEVTIIITQLLELVAQPAANQQYAGTAFRVSIAGGPNLQAATAAASPFVKPVEVTVSYDPENVSDPNKLRLYRYDEARQAWVEAGVGDYTIGSDTVTVAVDQVGDYALFEVDNAVYLPLVNR
jgi:hypothetical protein